MKDKRFEIIHEQDLLGKEFKVYGDFENPMFLAKDVAEWIDYSKTSEGYYNVSKMLMTVDESEKSTITNGNSGGKSTFLTEDGVYEVLMQSRKPIAKQFKKKVKEILKDIRLNDMYIKPEALFKMLSTPDAMIAMLTKYRDEKELRMEAERKLETQRPLVEFAEAVAGSADTIDVGQLAKLVHDENIPIGRNRLFKWLREQKYLRDNNEPYQQHIKLGWFDTKELTRNTPYGTKLYIKTLVTGKGQVAIVERLRRDFDVA